MRKGRGGTGRSRVPFLTRPNGRRLGSGQAGAGGGSEWSAGGGGLAGGGSAVQNLHARLAVLNLDVRLTAGVEGDGDDGFVGRQRRLFADLGGDGARILDEAEPNGAARDVDASGPARTRPGSPRAALPVRCVSADGANREFGKMIAQGGHVTPSIESNPLTACTRIGILRFSGAAEGS